MQRRLFALFLLLSLIPAIAILAVNWQLSQRHLGFLDSPGLRAALESSLDLARGELNRELAGTEAQLQRLAATWTDPSAPLPSPAAGTTLALIVNDAVERSAGPLNPELETHLVQRAGRRETVRIEGDESDWLVAAHATDRGVLVLARPLDPDLRRNLDAVEQGGARIRQMRLYYGDLLRGDTTATLIALGVIVLIVALVLSRSLARGIARPLGALADGTRQVAAGDLDHRVDVKAPAEIGELVSAFNRMTDDLRTSKQDLMHAERVAAWQGVARRLAHEIKNPLTPITLAMHRIGKRVDDPAVTDSVHTVLEETENLKRLADEFSQYARLPEPWPETVDLAELAGSVVELYAEDGRLTIEWELPDESATVRVDPGQMRQVLANLVKNAIAATGGSGPITIRLAGDDKNLNLEVIDGGPGLPEPPERIFEPYFTTKATGTGLGLPIARKIVEDHRGALTAHHRPGGGAILRLELPRHEANDSEAKQ